MELYDFLLLGSPLWVVFLVTVLIVLVSVYIGYQLGNYISRRSKDNAQASASSVVAASLGLLAFMLAFTFGIASSRFDTRKQIVLDEVNAIGTAYLRADLLPETARNEVKKLLLEYVDLRAGIAQPEFWNKPAKIHQIIEQSEALQDKLWSYTVVAGMEKPDDITGLFIESLNDLIDLHTTRVVIVLQYRVPGMIWSALYLLTILSFGLIGYEIGISGGGASKMTSIIMALAFSTVILLITDLDRPMQGRIKVSQEPMIQLQQKLHGEIP